MKNELKNLFKNCIQINKEWYVKHDNIYYELDKKYLLDFLLNAVELNKTLCETEISDEELILPNVTISSPQYIPYISDDEIEKKVNEYILSPFEELCWKNGAKWYREQLKKKQ